MVKRIETSIDSKGLEFASLCSSCSSIKENVNSEGNWFNINEDPEAFRVFSEYLYSNENVRLSHGYCPECLLEIRAKYGLKK